MKKEILKKWEEETNNLAKHFSKYYFGKYPEEWWIAEEYGGVYVINDYFFSVQDMADFLRYSYSRDKMFEYMDYRLEKAEKGELTINIKNYKNLNKKDVVK